MSIVYDIKFLGVFLMHLCNKEISSLWPRHIDWQWYKALVVNYALQLKFTFWFSTLDALYFWYLKGWCLFETGSLFHFWERTECYVQNKTWRDQSFEGIRHSYRPNSWENQMKTTFFVMQHNARELPLIHTLMVL